MSSYTCRNIYPYDMFNAFEDEIGRRMRRDISDALFSVPEGEICLVRWYEERKYDTSDEQSGRVDYSIVLDIINLEDSDFTPLDFTPFKGLIERLEARIKRLERLCRDMYRALDNVGCTAELLAKLPNVSITNESAEKTRRDIDYYKERMVALELLGVE